MTTIATDGFTMASDGRVTSGDTITDTDLQKVHKLKDGRVAGRAGDMALCLAIIDWLNGEVDDYPPAIGDSAVMVIDGTGRIETYYSANSVPIVSTTPQAIGSGMAFALAAMDAGLSPKEAVQIAAKRDVWTGGKIRTLTVKR